MTLPLQVAEEAVPVADEPVIIAIGTLYILVILAIGVLGWRATEDISDFLITGKSIGTWVMALAVFAVIQSGFGFVGGPELVYEFGSSAFWIFFSAPIGFLLVWVLVAKPMRLLTEVRNVLTLGDGMYVRYDSQSVRGFTGFAVLVGILGYLAVNLAALQYVMRAIFGLPLELGLFLGALILLLYSAFGGMIAGVWTDFVQGITMIVGAVIVFVYAISVGGGMTNISQNLATADPNFLGPFGALGAMTALSWFLLFFIGDLGQVHGITKFYMIRDAKLLKWGAPIAIVSYALSSLLAFGAGLSMRAMVEAETQAELDAAAEAMPVFVLNYTPDVIAGLVLAGLLAAIMSSSDSFLNIGAAAITRDMSGALGRPIDDPRRELVVTQVVLVAIMVVATGIVFFSEALVGILGVIGWAFFAAAFVPVVGLGLNWKGATPQGAVAAIVISIVLNFVYDVAPTMFNVLGQEGVAESILASYPLPEGFVVGTMAMLVSTIVFIVVSMATQDRHEVPADIAAVLDR